MKSTFSVLDIQTRMELRDLLSRFCHAIDHNQVDEWADIFLPDASVEAPRFGKFIGREQIKAIPGFVAEEGKGHWRHIFNNVLLHRTNDLRTCEIQAYCTVNDWRKNGAAVRFWDFSATVEKKRQWRIKSLMLRPVGAFCDNPRSYLNAPLADAEVAEPTGE